MNRFLASLPLLLAPVVLGQTTPPAPPTTTAPAAQTAQPKFVIADVHVSPTASGFAQNFGGVVREGLYINRDATMLTLIQAAYGVSEDAISGGPGWVSSDLFDVVARVPDGTTPATASLMLQNLLADRFALVVHSGINPVPRYVLSIGKGSRLKPSDGTGDSGCKAQPQSGPPPSDPASQPNIKVTCHNLTTAAIATNLHQMANGYLDHDVIDSTKLEGSWDFDIEWTGRGALAAKGPDGISIFDAVDKQLGLKLQLQNVPLPSFAIASVNRQPTPNASDLATALALPAARFEVATIKPADPSARPFTGIQYAGGSTMHAGGTLRAMMSMALQISPNISADMITGLPKSADTQAWDITGKVPMTGEGAPNMISGRPSHPP